MSFRITKRSSLTGVTRTLESDFYTQEEFDRRYAAFRRGENTLEYLLPKLPFEQLQFIKNGTTEKEWESYNTKSEYDSAMAKWANTTEIFF